ncbi:MAG TPA: ATPase, T2SS/T4P/T4SS family, partial [Bryobacteraceae bacterium]|nr:ATPase, T2SS/T4P/T4SS family [Bryobacteraceae bacterium]
MNDNAIATIGGTGRVALGGLAQRLVQDGLLDEQAMQDAIVRAKEKRVNLVTHLVATNLATARDIAISASNEFGVPLLDLDAVAPDMDAVRAVSDKLLQKHRVLPLMKRGKRLFLAVADPTNLHALDEIRFQTSMSIEFVVVEDDKLQAAVGKAMDQAEAAMPSLTDDDFDLENLEVTGGEEDPNADALGRDDVEDAPIVRFVNKILLDAIKKGASDIHFEPYEKSFRIRTRLDGVLKEVAVPPVQLAVKIVARLKVMARLDIAERRV